VNVTGSNNEVVTGSGAEFLMSANIPENIRTVYFSTVPGPTSVGLEEPSLRSGLKLLLDLSRPIELGGSPSFATTNVSNLHMWSSNESWFTAMHTRLMQLFDARRTGYDWLHRPGVYDILLITIGVPFSLWANYRLGPFIERLDTASIIKAALYIYCFFVALYLFRLLFGYSRWVFPKLEIGEAHSAPLKHRLIWGAVMLAVFSNALYDLLKAII
jgi:hypothetical protein